jgi:hypothetical protein
MSLLAIADAGADATTKRLFHEITQLGEKIPDELAEQQTWLKTMEDMLRFCLREEEGFVKGQIVLLHYLEKAWPTLPEETRKAYKNNFWNYAEIRTNKDRGTLQNHLRAIRAFFIEGIAPNHSLQLPERDAQKRPVRAEEGGIALKVVPWNPVSVPLSKLVAITAKAKSGKMTDKLWTMAQDDGVTWEQLQLAMTTKGTPGSGSDPNMKFLLEGEFLLVTEGDDEAQLGVLHGWDQYYDNPDCLHTRALKRLIALLGILMDEEVLRRAEVKGRNQDVYPDNT